MLDLEHLEALDDDAPPEPDLDQARSRARRLRARHRWTAAAAAVVILGGAAAVAAAARGDDRYVHVAGPTAPTTPEEHPAVSGTLPNGVDITLTLDTPTAPLGSDIQATVVLHNRTGETKTLGVDPIQCALSIGPVLRDAAGHVVVNDYENGTPCYDIGVPLRAGGARTIEVTLPTTSVRIPPVHRIVRYSLSLARTGWSLGPLPIEIVVSEGITARLEVPQTRYPADYSLEGTIVFVNGTGHVVDYHVDCQRTPPWQVVLSKDGVLFWVPQAAVGCATNSGTTAHLAPGETRIPFDLALGYPACGSSGQPTLAAPRCTGGGIPDLAPGGYQIVFRGTDAPFTSIDVPPLDITVTARPTRAS